MEIQRHQRDRLLGALGWQSIDNLWDRGLKAPVSRVVTTAKGAVLRDFPGSFDKEQLA